jgi:hypothetical protein
MPNTRAMDDPVVISVVALAGDEGKFLLRQLAGTTLTATLRVDGSLVERSPQKTVPYCFSRPRIETYRCGRLAECKVRAHPRPL